MKAVLTLLLDVEDDAELAALRDLRSHVAIVVERRREVRSVEEARVTIILPKDPS